jgi:hypothetical protein
MYHLVYLITNLINNNIYVGKHSTYNLNDDYFGSGVAMLRAKKKYTKDNLRKDVLFYCLSEEDALEIERRIVNEDFIMRKDTYNVSVGGWGGFMKTTEGKLKHGIIMKGLLAGEKNPMFGKTHSEKAKQTISSKAKERTIHNVGKIMVYDFEGKGKYINKDDAIPEGYTKLGKQTRKYTHVQSEEEKSKRRTSRKFYHDNKNLLTLVIAVKLLLVN